MIVGCVPIPFESFEEEPFVELMLEGSSGGTWVVGFEAVSRLESGCNYLLILFSIKEFSFPPYMCNFVQSIYIC
jgi:hypothetical protein